MEGRRGILRKLLIGMSRLLVELAWPWILRVIVLIVRLSVAQIQLLGWLISFWTKSSTEISIISVKNRTRLRFNLLLKIRIVHHVRLVHQIYVLFWLDRRGAINERIFVRRILSWRLQERDWFFIIWVIYWRLSVNLLFKNWLLLLVNLWSMLLILRRLLKRLIEVILLRLRWRYLVSL